MKRIPVLCLLVFCCAKAAGQVSQFIHIDQFGYFTSAEKVAVLSDPQIGYNAAEAYAAPFEMEVRKASDDQIVFTGPTSVFNGGQTESASGDRGWWFDFSALTEQGDFYVFDATSGERSAVFSISENPYLGVLKDAGRMFFYNRCNHTKTPPFAQPNWTDGNNFLNALQDANCRFINQPTNAALEKDLSGGWFDAGDYNKYVTFAEGAIHDLLYAFEENPAAFGDDWNLPESGNSIPDVVDEIKWELDWLQKMMNPDGSTHLKMGSQNYSENVLSPPSANTDPRFYGPTCTSASASLAGMLAHAAILMKTIEGLEGYAAGISEKAETAFAFVLPFFENSNLQEDCDNGSIVAGDADRTAEAQFETILAASVYLFELTGKAAYHDFFLENYEATETMTSGFWGADRVVVQDALLRYTQLPTGNIAAQSQIQQSASTDVGNNWNGYFGFQANDLYRSFMPEWSYYWGSNRPKASYGSLNFRMANLGIGNNPNSLRRKATEHLHYFHGVNPLGMVMLSNMYGKGGDRCVNEIYHTWFYDGTDFDNALTSEKGPAPGYVTGGPNHYFSYTQLSPPANQPALKSYLDFNDGWPESSWEISEPAIYYQAAYIRLLANFVDADAVSPTSSYDFGEAKKMKAYPNPANEEVFLDLGPGNFVVRVIGRDGVVLKETTMIAGQGIPVGSLADGLYYFEATSLLSGEKKVGIWVKN